jgi:hypothetical protein
MRHRFTPSLARSVGLGPVFFPAERRLRHRAVHCEPRPVDPFELVVLQEAALPELKENAGVSPSLEPAMS